MIECKEITKKFGSKTVLDNFSAVFTDNSTTCLLAPSGAGKTTLLHIIAGLLPFDSGEIAGTDGKKTTVVFQTPRLLPWLTARENVEAVTKKKNEAAYFLEQTELYGEINKYPDNLSGGQKQRVALARAMAFGGDILLLDEPFTGLDEKLTDRIWLKIKERFKNAIIICSIHDSGLAEKIADKILTL